MSWSDLKISSIKKPGNLSSSMHGSPNKQSEFLGTCKDFDFEKWTNKNSKESGLCLSSYREYIPDSSRTQYNNPNYNNGYCNIMKNFMKNPDHKDNIPTNQPPINSNENRYVGNVLEDLKSSRRQFSPPVRTNRSISDYPKPPLKSNNHHIITKPRSPSKSISVNFDFYKKIGLT